MVKEVEEWCTGVHEEAQLKAHPCDRFWKQQRLKGDDNSHLHAVSPGNLQLDRV